MPLKFLYRGSPVWQIQEELIQNFPQQVPAGTTGFPGSLVAETDILKGKEEGKCFFPPHIPLQDCNTAHLA